MAGNARTFRAVGEALGRGEAMLIFPEGVSQPEPTLLGHQFKLHAYSLKDGAALLGDGYELPLVNEDPKATEPPDTKKVTETLGRGCTRVESDLGCDAK